MFIILDNYGKTTKKLKIYEEEQESQESDVFDEIRQKKVNRAEFYKYSSDDSSPDSMPKAPNPKIDNIYPLQNNTKQKQLLPSTSRVSYSTRDDTLSPSSNNFGSGSLLKSSNLKLDKRHHFHQNKSESKQRLSLTPRSSSPASSSTLDKTLTLPSHVCAQCKSNEGKKQLLSKK